MEMTAKIGDSFSGARALLFRSLFLCFFAPGMRGANYEMPPYGDIYKRSQKHPPLCPVAPIYATLFRAHFPSLGKEGKKSEVGDQINAIGNLCSLGDPATF